MSENMIASLQRKHRSAVLGLFNRLRSNYELICERYGNEEGVQLITDMARKYGLEIAELAKKRVEGTDAISIAKYLARIFETMGASAGDAEMLEVSKDKVVMKATACPLGATSREICEAHTTMEKTVVETINPNITYRIGMSVAGGDPYCEHIIETRSFK
jgi:hypothetical protein